MSTFRNSISCTCSIFSSICNTITCNSRIISIHNSIFKIVSIKVSSTSRTTTSKAPCYPTWCTRIETCNNSSTAIVSTATSSTTEWIVIWTVTSFSKYTYISTLRASNSTTITAWCNSCSCILFRVNITSSSSATTAGNNNYLFFITFIIFK